MSSSEEKHLFPVSQRREKSSRAEVPESRIPEERFEFNEDVEHGWTEIEIPCSER